MDNCRNGNIRYDTKEPFTRHRNSKSEETYQPYVEFPSRWGNAITMESEKRVKAKYELINAKYQLLVANKFTNKSSLSMNKCTSNTVLIRTSLQARPTQLQLCTNIRHV